MYSDIQFNDEACCFLVIDTDSYVVSTCILRLTLFTIKEVPYYYYCYYYYYYYYYCHYILLSISAFYVIRYNFSRQHIFNRSINMFHSSRLRAAVAVGTKPPLMTVGLKPPCWLERCESSGPNDYSRYIAKNCSPMAWEHHEDETTLSHMSHTDRLREL